jgi:CheY-like chemotaxis protein
LCEQAKIDLLSLNDQIPHLLTEINIEEDLALHKKYLTDIPVVVITAKELVPEERRRLNGRIQLLLQKGTFLDDELIAEIKKALEE